MQLLETLPKSIFPEEIENWFGEFIGIIKADQFMLETGCAPQEKEDFYTDLITNNTDKIFSKLRQDSSQFYIQKIVFDYLSELNTKDKKPLKLAFGISDSKILVWSEIEDNDESMEDILLICEAKVNGKYHQHGFYLNSTIIERSDKMPIPPHYKTIIE